ncbi:MAG: PucR family transcriptional regulator ligand-binding domain-containing protein [Clostridiales bacterium]|nr:PucR family transcriptional regulator ligand-binding domain-containing protein [Clostridiales bacterium]
MALTIRELIEQTRSKYRLKLLAGADSLDFVVTWVHMTEDTSVTEFFWGNEMVVTSGYTAQSEEKLLHFIDVLEEKRCAGVVINVGKYINEVPSRVLDLCEERHLPLLTMPWEMSITEFVRECCSLIDKSSQNEEALADAVVSTILSPMGAGRQKERLTDYFHVEQGFTMLALWAELPAPLRNVLDQRSTLRLHTALRPFDFSYLIFRYQKRFLILLNQRDRQVSVQVSRRILDTIHQNLPDLSVQIGVGEPVDALEQLADTFHAAVSAQRRASLQGLEIVQFQDMGFYKLLYSVPDDSLLESYYHEMMDPLLDHDRQTGSVYTETLFRYLLTDGSLQAVAAAMYTHRNTVGYRMGKIRELLGQDLDSQQQRMPYLLAYHVGVILKLCEDYE